MKKICLINGTTVVGGGPLNLLQLLESLDETEWEPIICSYNDGPYWEKFEKLSTKAYSIPLRKLSLSSWVKLRSILTVEKPDLIHTHGKGPGLYGRIAGWLHGIPVIHSFHGFHYHDLPLLKRKLHLLVENFLALITPHHILSCQGERNKARVIRLLKDQKVTIIHNGLRSTRFKELKPDKRKILASLGLESWENQVLVGAMSRISPEKGVVNLIHGFARVLKTKPNLRLAIIGSCQEEHMQYQEHIQALVKKLNLDNKIALLGYKERAFEILKTMDAYITSSLSEGLPYNVLEAIALERPIIATDIPGNNDIIRDSIEGILIPSDSIEGVRYGILKMFSIKETHRSTLIRNARERLEKEFSLEKMTSSVFSLYKKALKSQSQSDLNFRD